MAVKVQHSDQTNSVDIVIPSYNFKNSLCSLFLIVFFYGITEISNVCEFHVYVPVLKLQKSEVTAKNLIFVQLICPHFGPLPLQNLNFKS
jgi:hypothetical protein